MSFNLIDLIDKPANPPHISERPEPVPTEEAEDDFFQRVGVTRQQSKAQEAAAKEARKNKFGPPTVMQLAEPLASHGTIENEEFFVGPWELVHYYDDAGNIVEWVFDADERVDPKTGRKTLSLEPVTHGETR